MDIIIHRSSFVLVYDMIHIIIKKCYEGLKVQCFLCEVCHQLLLDVLCGGLQSQYRNCAAKL